MSETLYQFYQEQNKPSVETEKLKKACLTALGAIPSDLIQKMQERWNGENFFKYKVLIPKLEFSIVPYEDMIQKFIKEMIFMKYGYGWSVMMMYGSELLIEFDPKIYQDYKMIMSWINPI